MRSIVGGVLAMGTVCLAGCAASPLTAAMPGRSLALDSPQQHELAVSEQTDGLPWYAARNDVKPSVEFGSASATYQRSYTYTSDQINSYDGQVYNNFNQTSYRQSVRETVH